VADIGGEIFHYPQVLSQVRQFAVATSNTVGSDCVQVCDEGDCL